MAYLRKRLSIIVALIASGALVSLVLMGSVVRHVGYATDLALVDIYGRAFRLSDFKGKVVILEFTTTTCENCAQLHFAGYAHALYEKYKGRLEYISIFLNPFVDTDERVKAYRDFFKIRWIMVIDKSGKMLIDLKIKTLFEHWILDTNGVKRCVNNAAIEVVRTTYPTIIEMILNGQAEEVEKLEACKPLKQPALPG